MSTCHKRSHECCHSKFVFSVLLEQLFIVIYDSIGQESGWRSLLISSCTDGKIEAVVLLSVTKLIFVTFIPFNATNRQVSKLFL